MAPLPRLLPALILLTALSPAQAQTESPAEDEKLLKAAHLGVDGPALLEFVRKLVPTPADEQRVADLISRLGDKTFKVRERAVNGLIAVGPPALPALRKVMKGGDLETSRRAEQCVQMIERRTAP